MRVSDSAASRRATASPMPSLPPVIRTFFIQTIPPWPSSDSSGRLIEVGRSRLAAAFAAASQIPRDRHGAQREEQQDRDDPSYDRPPALQALNLRPGATALREPLRLHHRRSHDD